MAKRQRFLLHQVLDEIFVDPLSEDDVEDHLYFKKITVIASSKKYPGHREITMAGLPGEKCVNVSVTNTLCPVGSGKQLRSTTAVLIVQGETC